MDRKTGILLVLLTMVPGVAGAAGIELISRAPLRQAPDTAGAYPERPEISADGRYIAFASFSPNLAPGQVDPNGGLDVFFHDRVAGTTVLVSHAAGAPARAGEFPSLQPALSADGRFVAFASNSGDLVPGAGGADEIANLYLWDRESGQITLVSRRAGGDEGGDGTSQAAALSADGGVVVFTSRATDLVPGVTLERPGEQIYAWERATETISLVSRSAAAASRAANDSSFSPRVSADGRFVAYASGAADLVAGQNDGNEAQDVFLYDRLTGATALASHAGGSALTTSNGSSHDPSLSADGRFVAFASDGTDFVPAVPDTNDESDAFLYDRLLGTVTLVSAAGSGFEPRVSADGSTVVYFAGNPGNFPGAQILAYDVAGGARRTITAANQKAESFSISADGRVVAFASRATDLVAGQQDTNELPDVFVHDGARVVLASHALGSATRPGDSTSLLPAVSADGGWIAYGSYATDLVHGLRDPFGTPDLFLYGRAADSNRLVTVHPPGMASLTAPGVSQSPSLSADGRYVAFASSASLIPGLVVPPSRVNVYLHDRVTRRTVLVSRSAGPGLAGGDADSLAPMISRDGSAVVFLSRAGDLVPGQEDREDTPDVFHWDRRTGRTTLVSHAHASRVRAGTGQTAAGAISADGNLVAFSSTARDLVPRQRDANHSHDVFLWDRRKDSTVLVSHHGRRPARAGNGFSFFSSMSPDGAFIAFVSNATDLALPTGGDEQVDAFLYERRTGGISLLSRDRGAFTGYSPLVSANGRWTAFLEQRLRNDGGLEGSMVVLDRATGKTARVDLTGDPDGFGLPLGLSDDGRWLLFTSDAPGVVPGQIDDTAPATADLFLFDRVTRQVRLVSHVPGEPLRVSGFNAQHGRLSPDGRWVSFQSEAPLLPVPILRRVPAVYLYDRTTEDVTLVSRSACDPSLPGNNGSFDHVVVNNGTVAFTSQASDLVPRDFNFADMDVFVYNPEED